MKKLLLFILLILASNLFSQTGYRVRMLANLNEHFTSAGASYSALWGYTAPDNREYALLGCYTGTAFIDITDTNNIHEVDFLPTPIPIGFGNFWREMKTYSHYAYIVSEEHNSNIQIVDLQYLPDSIRYVGKFILPDHTSTHSISQSGAFLYLNGSNIPLSHGITILDLTNPEVPVLRGKWMDMYVHDSRIINDTIWACNISDKKVSIINAVNKDNPVTIRSWVHNPLPSAPHNIALNSNRNIAYVTDETTNPSSGKLKIWDVSDQENITYIRSFNSFPFENSIVHNLEVVGNYAFLAYYTAGIKVLDISNPTNPVEIGWFDTYPENNDAIYDGCWGIYYFNSGKIIASDMTRGLFVLRPDLTNPVSHFPVANFSLSSKKVMKLDTLRFIDATDGIPLSWQWTVTGPENKTSTLQYPEFTFNLAGDYNVKLKVTNSLGSDSVEVTNSFHVAPFPLTSFQVTSPLGNPTFITSPEDTSKVLFNWKKASIDPKTTYKLNFRKIENGSEKFFLSGNNGLDTFALLTKSFLDSMAQSFGLTGDSLMVRFKAMAYNITDSLISSNQSIIKLKRNSVGIHNISQVIPGEYKLYNNYPNPFNPSTNIEFDLPVSEAVSLELYDITGKKVFDMLNENLSPGKYKYTLNGSNLNSGVYFIKFSAGSFTSVRKILLVK
ncbi:MAG: choice-of-anchor B family protein [Ignavibacteria bacterium]